jgi:transglutaminase-like putative cysteine protease
MRYTIRHSTRFTYESVISESVMEARMQPRSDGAQRCLRFGLTTTPNSRVRMYQDHEGNVVHHFNVPGQHSRLIVTAEALVDCAVPFTEGLPVATWTELDAQTASGEFWECVNASAFTPRTPLLDVFADDIQLTRLGDPFTTVKYLSEEMHARFEYSPHSTRVDSPIDEALGSRRGVCQDFAHIMIALVRRLGVPCRYVSGYLFQNADGPLRSSDGATHAWVEAWLPGHGWIGFDPTNRMLAGDQHIRVAVGRDYADVPPTKGIFKGTSAVRSELAVAVRVGPVDHATDEAVPFTSWQSREIGPMATEITQQSQQQQQQQQQQ